MDFKRITNRWDTISERIKNYSQYPDPNMHIITPVSNGRVRIYISQNRNQDMSIYIPFENEQLFKDYKRPKKNGIDVEIVKENAIDKDVVFYKIDRLKNCPEEVFVALSFSVIEAIDDSKTEFDIINNIEEVFNQYSRLFEGKRSRLSKEAEQGLFGELLFLNELIEQHGDEAVFLWHGPEKNAHDFLLDEKNAVEIKATSNKKQTIVTISSENQLDNSGFDSLRLVVFVVDVNEVGQQLISLARSIANRLISINAKMFFLSALASSGVDLNLYESSRKYSLIQRKEYYVDDLFPKITKGNIQSGIFDVDYKLNLEVIDQRSGNDERSV